MEATVAHSKNSISEVDKNNDSQIVTDSDTIERSISLTDINLPNQWVLYLYDKALFKRIANRPNFQASPNKEMCTLGTVNDLLYFVKLMEVRHDSKTKMDMYDKNINLDSNNYIIMRKGIEPIWEDPKNSNGGIFSIKVPHHKGYDIWSAFLLYMTGETLTEEMEYINGISVSYIFHDSNGDVNGNERFTNIKIWDGKRDRTRDQFINILPADILQKIKGESIIYSANNKKKHYGQEDIISKITSSKQHYGNNNSRKQGGFVQSHRRR